MTWDGERYCSVCCFFFSFLLAKYVPFYSGYAKDVKKEKKEEKTKKGKKEKRICFTLLRTALAVVKIRAVKPMWLFLGWLYACSSVLWCI